MNTIFNFAVLVRIIPQCDNNFYPTSFDSDATKYFRKELKREQRFLEGLVKSNVVLNSINFSKDGEVLIYFNSHLHFDPSKTESIDFMELPNIVSGAFERVIKDGFGYEEAREFGVDLVDVSFK